MITVYKAFQLVLGIIFSGFILFFLIQYASDYSSFGKTKQSLTVLNNLKKTSESVYFSGNPVVFNDTKMFDFSSCEIAWNEPEPPAIKCDFGEISPVSLPIFPHFEDRKESIIDAEEIDYGWWRFRFITALPEMHVIFIPEDIEDKTWNIMKNLTRIFPDTQNFHVKITFGFCDGNTLLENICGGKPCEREAFLKVLDFYRAKASPCNTALEKNYILVTVSQSCRQARISQGICVKPVSPEMGYIYTPRSQDIFVYKDPVDILALIIGGNEEDILGKSSGEKLYHFKNTLLLKNLAIAAEFVREKSYILRSEYQKRCDPQHNPESIYCRCYPLYNQLYSKLGNVMKHTGNDYTKYGEMEMLKLALEESKSIYADLIKNGCE